MTDVQMKGITCCADCAYYSMKKHKCTRGYKDEGKSTDHFYKDCPLPDVRPVVRGKWTLNKDGSGTCSVCKRRHKDVYDDDASDLFCRSCGAKMEAQDDN